MANPLPLFTWEKQAEAYRLQQERDILVIRIRALPPRSHRRIELEFRLRDITLREIAIEVELQGPRHG